jgi:hypothetical protein
MTGRDVPGPKLRLATPSSKSSASPRETGFFFASSCEPTTMTDWIELKVVSSFPVAVTVTCSRTADNSIWKSAVAVAPGVI